MSEIAYDLNSPDINNPQPKGPFVPRAELVPDMSIEDYHDLGNIAKHGDKAVLSKSMLPELICPEDFQWKYLFGNAEPDADHLNVGNAVHTLALEPRLFEDRFYVLGEGIVRNAKHEKYQNELANAAGRKIITPKDFVKIQGMADALRRKPKALALLDAPGKIEASIFWTDPETGIKLRCRPDFMRDDRLIVDLKTGHTAEPGLFFSTAWDFFYDVSAAMTTEGYEALTGEEPQNYVFLVIEDKPPHKIEIYDTFRPDDFGNVCYVEAGKVRLRKLLQKYKFCRENDYWPSYNDVVVPMGYPYRANKFLNTGEMK